MSKVFLVLLMAALANAQQGFEARPIQQRAGFGVNAGFDSSLGGVQGGLNFGSPVASSSNNNLFFPIVVGLGLLSFFNLVLTVFLPLLKNLFDGDAKEKARSIAAAFQLDQDNLTHMAMDVFDAVQKMSDIYQQ